MKRILKFSFYIFLSALCSWGCQKTTQLTPSPVPVFLSTGRAAASNQSIPRSFTATIISIVPVKNLGDSRFIKGYLIDNSPKWVIEMNVLPHNRKMAFQPGIRKCYIASLKKVFGTLRSDIHGQYRFTYICNVDVPGKTAFENFKAHKK